MVRPSAIAPVRDDAANDHQIFEHDREISTATVGAEHAELFMQRHAPNRLAGLAIDTHEVVTNA